MRLLEGDHDVELQATWRNLRLWETAALNMLLVLTPIAVGRTDECTCILILDLSSNMRLRDGARLSRMRVVYGRGPSFEFDLQLINKTNNAQVDGRIILNMELSGRRKTSSGM